MITKILFSNPRLEYRLRRMVQTHHEEEIGGWFIINSSNPICWPDRFDYGAVEHAIGGQFRMIDGVIVAPNMQRDKATKYSAWDDAKARELAWETAQALHGYTLAWHTHPNGNEEPSNADIAHHASVSGGYWASFAVVTAYPFRIWPYDVVIGGAQAPQAGFRLDCGEYVSWQRGVMQQFR